MEELKKGVESFVKDGTIPDPTVFQHPLAFNVIPHIDAFQENGYTKEEMKVAWELRKIFELPQNVKARWGHRGWNGVIVLTSSHRIDLVHRSASPNAPCALRVDCD